LPSKKKDPIPFEWITPLRSKYLRNYFPPFSSWHKICSLRIATIGKVASVNMMIKELASANLLFVLVVILVGFGVIKIVKKRLED
jgi:hypothetical protein